MAKRKPSLQQNTAPVKPTESALQDFSPEQLGHTHYSKGSVARRVNE